MYPYQDVKLSPEERAQDLFSRMSLEEKMGQVQCYSAVHTMGHDMAETLPHGAGQVSCLIASALTDYRTVAAMIRRDQEKLMTLSEHHIPAIFHIETLTGTLIPGATSFPSGIGQAATWDPALQKKMARVIGRQTRAVGFRQGLAPVLDISRDPRFGRQGESYGEDPTLASAMGTAYVCGLQNDGNLQDGVLATSKHFLAFQAGEGGIHTARCAVPARELREVHAKPFQAAITDGALGSVMNSYATINGEPVVGSTEILTNLLRKEMKFKGLTVSDYSSVEQLYSIHKVCETKEDAGERALHSGMDSELPTVEGYNEALAQRFRSGAADVQELDRAVLHLLTAKFELGLFENPYPAEQQELDEAFHADAAREVSLQTARESLVLLKNDGTLPLHAHGKKIAVIGYHAASVRALFGGYSFAAMRENTLGVRMTMAGVQVENSSPSNQSQSQCFPGSAVALENPEVDAMLRGCYPDIQSLLESLRAACPDAEITYAYGYPYAGDDESHFAEALTAAEQADYVILTLGGRYGWNVASTSGEGIDMMNVNLPPCQEKFLRALAKLNKPAVAVHFDGHPISSDAAEETLNAILEAWTPGECGAQAITEVLLGQYNPGGKLPVSVARNAGQVPVYYAHENGSGYNVGGGVGNSSYVDGPREPRYFFGYGLSYTTFAYSNFKLSKTKYLPEETLEAEVTLKNTGICAGEEVVQLYAADLCRSMAHPVMELVGFRRVALAAGEEKTVRFKLSISQLAFLDTAMRWKIEAGEMELQVGTSSKELPLTAHFRILQDAYIEGSSRGFCAKSNLC